MRHITRAVTVGALASLGPGAATAQLEVTSRPPASTTSMVSFRTTRGTRLAFDVSPDGRTIVFDLLGQLWLLPVSGGEARAITDAVRDTAEDVDPSFSPDGATILFQGDRPGSRSLWLLDREGGVPRSAGAARIGYGARATSAWSPDGMAFAYVRLDSLVVRELSPAPGVDLGERAVRIDGVPNVRPASPAWTPDKSALVFVHGGRVWRVPIEGGRAEPVTDSSVVASAPAYALDGRLAFLAPDSAGRLQVWVRDAQGPARMLTSHEDVAPHRVRWLPNGHMLLYSADGALWRVAADGGTPQEIPFTASVRFERRRSSLRRVSFARPGEKRAVRGFSALALAPDASRIAMIALDSLWVWRPGDTPRAVRKMPSRAYDLAWAPTGDRVVWTGGLAGTEDLFATNVTTGATRRLTQLPGVESKAAWSPDGRHLAFLYAAPGSVVPRVLVHADTTSSPAAPVARTADVRDLGELSGAWVEEQSFVWRGDGRALLTYVNPLFDPAPFPARLRFLPLDGSPRMLAGAPNAVTFASWVGDSALVYVDGNRLWRAALGSDGVVGVPRAMSDDAALAVSTARDGTVLYLSDDGLRLRRPSGRVQHLGWPLSYRAPEAPGALVIRNVRVFDGVASVLSAPRDIVVEHGRVARMAPAGSIEVRRGMQAIDAVGRVAIPGLIDMHSHALFDTRTAGQLYYGVTTVRDVGSPAPGTAAARDAVDAGARAGARIVMGGFLFYSTAGSGVTGFTQQIVQDSGAIDRGMRIARTLGAHYVKQRTFEDWSSAVRTIASAHAQGLRVSGHCAHILPLVAAGIDGKEHSGDCFRDFGRIYDDFTSLYAGAHLWVDPTTGFWEPLRQLATDTVLFDRRDVSPFVAPGTRALYGRPLPASTIERGNRRNVERTAALIAAGVPLVSGTDAGMPQALHWELGALVRAGLTPPQALMAATSVAARVLGADADLGTIALGKLADLVILDGNPLDDISNTQRIWRVVQGGRIVDRDALLDAEAKAAVADPVMPNVPPARCPSSPIAGRAVCSHERCPPARGTGRCQP